MVSAKSLTSVSLTCQACRRLAAPYVILARVDRRKLSFCLCVKCAQSWAGKLERAVQVGLLKKGPVSQTKKAKVARAARKATKSEMRKKGYGLVLED